MTESLEEKVRDNLAKRLHLRLGQIELEIFTHICDTTPEPALTKDAEYKAALRQTVAAVVQYGLAGIAHGDTYLGPIPSVAIGQAHRAARTGVNLATIISRYLNGYRFWVDFVIQETDDLSALREVLRHILSTQAGLLEGLIASIVNEYALEHQRIQRSPKHRLALRVQRLLVDGPVGSSELGGYKLEAWHLGIIAKGSTADQSIQGLAAKLGCQLLSLPSSGGTTWAWLGSQRRIGIDDIAHLLQHNPNRPTDVSLAIGEPGHGVLGWRMTHRQAQEALSVTFRQPRALTPFIDVALIAPWVQNEAVAHSLVETFLSPLDGRGCSGETLRDTLRAYFKARHNASAAASALGVTPRTMHNRLMMVKEALGSVLDERQPELELALRLDALGFVTPSRIGQSEGQTTLTT